MGNDTLRARRYLWRSLVIAVASLVLPGVLGVAGAQATTATITSVAPGTVWVYSPAPQWWAQRNGPSFVITGTDLKATASLRFALSELRSPNTPCSDSELVDTSVNVGQATNTAVTIPVGAVPGVKTYSACLDQALGSTPRSVTVSLLNNHGGLVATTQVGYAADIDSPDPCADISAGNGANFVGGQFTWSPRFINCTATHSASYQLTLSSDNGQPLAWVPGTSIIKTTSGTTAGPTCVPNTGNQATATSCTYKYNPADGTALAEWDISGSTNSNFDWSFSTSDSVDGIVYTDQCPEGPHGTIFSNGASSQDPLTSPGTSMN